MPRLPNDAPPDTLRFLKDLESKLRKLAEGNVDLSRRRFTNASPAVSRGDFITKAQFDDQVEEIVNGIKVVDRNLRRAINGVVVGGNTTGSSLPAPNHPMDFGYYKVNTVNFGGDLTAEVKGYTNLTYVGAVDYGPFPSPASDRIAAMTAAVKKFAENNIYMMLDMEFGQVLTQGDVLTLARPYWEKVKYICMGDDGFAPATGAALDNEITQTKTRINNLGLAMKPIGITLTPNAVLTGDLIFATQLDFVNVEAYTPSPQSHGGSQQNLQTVKQLVDRQIARVPAAKKVLLILQGYDRNGCFRPVSPDLVDMQDASYMWVKDNTRVVGMLIFSYGREGAVGDCGVEYGGSHKYSELAARHKAIWSALNGGGDTGANRCGQGRPCCGGEDNDPSCPRWCTGGDYEGPVRDAQDRYIAGAPATVIDPANHNHILDVIPYMAGVVAQFNSDNPTVVARVDPGHDGKEIQVKKKTNAEFSEQHVLWSGGGDAAFVRRFYAATCYPSQF